MKLRTACLQLLAFGIAAGAQAQFSVAQSIYTAYFCIEDLVLVPEIPIRHPVGCEIIDCCPGCPGPGEIDWNIRVSGDPAVRTVFEFQRLPAEGLKKLSLKGNARLVEGNRIEIGQGDSSIGGFPADTREGPVIGSGRIVLSKAWLDQSAGKVNRAAADQGPPEADRRLGKIEVSIVQMLGQISVREYRQMYFILRCHGGGGGGSQDFIRLRNMSGTDSATILLDGRRSAGCVDDEVQRASPNVGVGNVLSNQTCNTETAVFAQNNAMQFATPVNVWTNAATDTETVNMAAVIQVPVTAWVLQGPFAQTQTQANNDVARANQLYNTMQAGVGFAPVTMNNATGNPNAAGLLNGSCANAAQFSQQIGFANGQLNVYYISVVAGGNRGQWCGGGNPNMMFVGASISDNESLSHEIGHAFSLGHTNLIAGIPATNLMVTGGVNRNSVTTGQSFRVNVNSNSQLNANGNRNGPARTCPDATTSNTCPSLALDVLPK